MTDEQLKQGQILKAGINNIHSQIRQWEQARSVASISLNYIDGDRYRTTETRCSVNFSELKGLILRHLKNRLEELEKEYAEL